MAKGGIKGITIEIAGDSSKLVKSLEAANKATSAVYSNLRQVNQALKLDPGNVEALAKKQELLEKAIAATTQKLEAEKAAAEEAKKALELGQITQDQYDSFDAQILKTTSSLNDLNKQLTETYDTAQELGATELIPEGASLQMTELNSKTELLTRGLAVVAAAGNAAGVALEKGFEIATLAAQKAYDAAKQVGEWSYDISSQVIDAYGNYEQLAGGVEKLFGSAAQTVIRNSANAYKTAGLDANEYLQTVTSFSASLIQGLGGDTARAAQLADTALQDMSDNANTFGSDISTIMSAYQGFAKGNFNMLDNLRLGYGGTKTEMIRLINDSHILEEEITSLDDISFDQMISAIHNVQEQLTITGTTSREAERTIQGSIAALKASWQNLLIGLGQEQSDIDALTNNVADALVKVLDNIEPVLERMADRLPEIAPILISKLRDSLPDAAKVGAEVFAAVCQSIIEAAPDMANAVMEALGPTLDQIFGEGTAAKVQEALNTLIDRAPELISNVVEPLVELTSTLIEHLPQIVDAAIPLIEFVADNLPQIAATLAGITATGAIASIGIDILNVVSAISALSGTTGTITGVSTALTGVGTAGAGAATSLSAMAATAGPIALLAAEIAALGYEAYTLVQYLEEGEQMGLSWTETLVGGALEAQTAMGGLASFISDDLADSWYDFNRATDETFQTIDQQAQQACIDIELAIDQSGARATQSVADDCAVIQSYLDNLEANGQIELRARVITEYQTIMSQGASQSGDRSRAEYYSTQARRAQNQQNWANSIHASAQAEYAARQAEIGRAAVTAIEQTSQTAQRAIAGGTSGGGGRGGGGGGGSSKSDEDKTSALTASKAEELLTSIDDKFTKLLEKFGISTGPTEYQNNVNQMIDGLLKALETNYSDASIEAAKAEIQKTMGAFGIGGEINAQTLEQLRNAVNNPAVNTEAFGQVQASVSAIQAATVDYTPHFLNIEGVLGQLLTLKMNESDTINVFVGNELLDTYIQQSLANQAIVSGGVA